MGSELHGRCGLSALQPVSEFERALGKARELSGEHSWPPGQPLSLLLYVTLTLHYLKLGAGPVHSLFTHGYMSDSTSTWVPVRNMVYKLNRIVIDGDFDIASTSK